MLLLSPSDGHMSAVHKRAKWKVISCVSKVEPRAARGTRARALARSDARAADAGLVDMAHRQGAEKA